MVRLANSRDALDAYQSVLEQLGSCTSKHNHNFEIQDLILEISSAIGATGRLKSFLDFVFEEEPLRLGKGLRKAERAYVRTGDRITKPSYIKRVRSFPDFSKKTRTIANIDQIKSVARGVCEEPNASYHVISIFRPVDLLEKFRPGYVPCIICADFKYRAKRLDGKFFFRSCDGYNLLPFDMFYCIGILEQLVDQIMANQFQYEIKPGRIMFWFSRIYVSRFDTSLRDSMINMIERFKQGQHAVRKKKVGFINRDAVRRSPRVILE
jgi:Thymidylate synthase